MGAQVQGGQQFSIQPALNWKGSLDAPGYSYRYIGGDATRVIIPNEVMESNCLLEYSGEGFFPASLSEPVSCIVGGFHAMYHVKAGTYLHEMDIREGGTRPSWPARARWAWGRSTTPSTATASPACWW